MKLKIPVTAKDHHRGPLHAAITLVEYGDIECPHCARAMPEIERVIKEFKRDLCFVYRHFPLSAIHPNAAFAALAAEAAAEQDQFWPMLHYLYQTSDNLSVENIYGCATALDLDLDQFEDDVDREDLQERVSHDIDGGIQSGVNGTPTLFMNGGRLDIPVKFDLLKAVILQNLNAQHEHRF